MHLQRDKNDNLGGSLNRFNWNWWSNFVEKTAATKTTRNPAPRHLAPHFTLDPTHDRQDLARPPSPTLWENEGFLSR
jgi:hypothetical protein